MALFMMFFFLHFSQNLKQKQQHSAIALIENSIKKKQVQRRKI